MTAGPTSLYPIIYAPKPPTLNLDFTNGQALDPRITFSRASSATRTNAAGTLVSETTDVPRFDYDPVTLNPKGLLIEEARTNIALRSEDLANAVWTVHAVATLTSNTATAPDGASTADRLQYAGAGGSGTVLLSQTVTVSNASKTFTVSFYLKSNTGSNMSCRIDNQYTGGGDTFSSDLTITPTWQRFSVTTTNGGIDSGQQGIIIVPSTGNAAFDILVWGATMEEGAFITSYIPTVAATVTRALDNALMTGTSFSSWYGGSTEGTFTIDVIPEGDSGSDARFLNVWDGGTNEQIQIQLNSSDDKGLINIRDGGVDQVSATFSSALTLNTLNKIALAFKENNFAAVSNGGSVMTDTSGTVPSPTEMYIGSFNASLVTASGWYQKILFYNTRIPDAKLLRLTS